MTALTRAEEADRANKSGVAAAQTVLLSTTTLSKAAEDYCAVQGVRQR